MGHIHSLGLIPHTRLGPSLACAELDHSSIHMVATAKATHGIRHTTTAMSPHTQDQALSPISNLDMQYWPHHPPPAQCMQILALSPIPSHTHRIEPCFLSPARCTLEQTSLPGLQTFMLGVGPITWAPAPHTSLVGPKHPAHARLGTAIAPSCMHRISPATLAIVHP